MNDITTFFQGHKRLEKKDFLQIDFCRCFSGKNHIEMIFSSFWEKKTDVFFCPFPIFDFGKFCDMLPANISSALSYFAEKTLAPYSTENFVLLSSVNESFSFFHRQYLCGLQNNRSFFEARKNCFVPEKNQQQIQYSIATTSFVSGKYRVAFAPRAACFLIHELFGHIFENHRLLNSFLTRGFKCPSGFYFYDDPTSPCCYGSYEFDANLNKSKRCECIHNGEILTSMDLLENTLTAQRVEDWEKMPEGRMSNIFLDIVDVQEDIPFDLYVEDCFEGEEASFLSDILTLKTRSCFASDNKLFKGTVIFSVNVFDFYHKYISSFSIPCQRAIDCFKSQSGWIRTSAKSPGIILDAVQAHLEPATNVFR